jgi:signal transduction histidine kinase
MPRDREERVKALGWAAKETGDAVWCALVPDRSLLAGLCRTGLGLSALCGLAIVSFRALDLRWMLAPVSCGIGAWLTSRLLRHGRDRAAAWCWIVAHSFGLFVPFALLADPALRGDPVGMINSLVLQVVPFAGVLLTVLAGVLIPGVGGVVALAAQAAATTTIMVGAGGVIPAAYWMAFALSAVGLGVAQAISASLLRAASEANAGREAVASAESLLGAARRQLQVARDRQKALRADMEEAWHERERYEMQVGALTHVSHLMASTFSVTDLLAQSVEAICRHLNVSTALYTIEGDAGWIRLAAASEANVALLLRTGEQVRLDGHTLIDQCLTDRAPHAVGDVTAGTVHAGHLGGGARSQAVAPLIARDEVLGILELQSPEPERFSEADLLALRLLAERLASGMAEIRALEQVRQAQRELSRLQRQYVEEAWDRFAPQLEAAGYLYDAGIVSPLGHRPLPEVLRVVDRQEPEVEPGGRLAVPIALRGKVIGAIGLGDPAGDRLWTTEDINLVESVARQMSVVMENARLLEETQRTLAEITELNRRYVHQAWDEFLGSEERADFVFAQPGVDGDEPLPAEVERVLALSQTLSTIPPDGGQPESALVAPINVRQQIIGALGLEEKGEVREWTADDLALVDAVASEMSWAVENARLLAESERRAVQLGQTAKQLREVDQFRAQFLANMSHELRTPLNSIIGFSRVILKGIDGPLTDLQKTDLEAIHSNGQHLLAMINEILDMSKIEAGRMDLTIERVDLQALIRGVISASTALVQGRPIELRTDIQDPLPTIWADGMRLRQVITNLMSNATKFTSEGAITFRAWSDEDMAYVSVEDTGEGIPEEKIPLVFEPFRQVDGSPTRKAQGTGLGMPISRQYIEMHDGGMWLESEYGVGSKFTFCVPIEGPVEPVPELEGLPLEPQKRLILLIAGDDSALGAYRRVLQRDKFELVGLCEEGDAVRWARYLRPWAIVIDCDQADVKWNALESLKSWRATQDLPVIVCCAPDLGARAVSMGAAAHVVRPVVAKELRKALSRLQR